MKDGFYTKKGEILKIRVVINYIILLIIIILALKVFNFNLNEKTDCLIISLSFLSYSKISLLFLINLIS